MKTTPKKPLRGAGGEGSLRLRDSKNEKPEAPLPRLENDDDIESELPIRGRPSKKLLLQQQQQQQHQRSQFQVKLEPDMKTVSAATRGPSGGRSKAKRSLYKKGGGNNAATQKSHSESYVMRLFERSLDLSKYKDKTPLYPICRAWMANQPRNPNVAAFSTDSAGQAVKREDDAVDVLAKLRSNEIKILKQLPQARSTEMLLVPSRLKVSEKDKQKEQELKGAGKAELLAANVTRWKRVRGQWLRHAQQYGKERYEVIDQIMDIVCKT